MPRFVPRQRKHKVLQREAARDDELNVNTNQVQILPRSKEEEESRRKLKEDLRAGQTNISSKKQKRLDKYIENKLKKDENLELLKKLSLAKFDTSQLQSSKHLGKRTHTEFAADFEHRKDGTAHIHARLDTSEDSDLESADSFELQHGHTMKGGLKSSQQNGIQCSGPTVIQGSGLRQPLAIGSDGLPVIHSRKKKSKRKSVEEDSWEGFDSEVCSDDSPTGDRVENLSEDMAARFGTDSDEGSGDEHYGSSTELSDSENESSEEDDSEARTSNIAPRTSAFKSWATQQINDSLGHVPFKATDYTQVPKSATVSGKSFALEALSDGPVREEDQKLNRDRKAYNVVVNRSVEIEELRIKLPVVAEEQKIMEAIHNNPCVIVWGTTGSGKTTQVPQFLFEAGYGSHDGPTPGMIGITQPRRVAAVSMAKRVGEELGQHAEKVSYQIRFETTTSKNTALKYMTDGILLREISRDFALLKYSAIIIDEAHERSVNTDILIGMLSRIVDLRRKMSLEDSTVKPLKLVIMSATLRVSDFLQNANLFPLGLPPLVQAEGRQFPVMTHFARTTQRDYLEVAFSKISRGHRKLPPGGILVFLTGQNEIKALLKRLQDALESSSRSAGSIKVQLSASEAPLEIDDFDMDAVDHIEDDDEDDDVDFLGHDGENEDVDFNIGEPVTSSHSVHILPLYSQLPTKEQLRVFESPPEGSRLIVLATNVAETSLTIPGIRYVFDCGRSKERVYDQSNGVQKFEINWISKASAEQRAGRAGRTGPGHCYRLYSSAVYERDFAEYADPEILRTPIESVVLQLKTMGLDSVVNFPFPTPPERSNLIKAERLLKILGALTSAGQVTELGHRLSIYPLSPRYGKMLAIGSQHGCLPYIIAIVSGLAVGDIFIPENQLDLHPKDHEEDKVYTNEDKLKDTAREERRKEYNKARATFSNNDPTSDVLKLLSAVCAYAYADNEETFCHEMFLRSKTLKEISQLRSQLTSIVQANHPQSIGPYGARLPSPSSKQVKALNQIVAAGFVDRIALRAELSPNPPPTISRKPKRAIDVPYLALSPPNTIDSTTAAAAIEAQAIYLHPSSVLARLNPKNLPQYVIYSHLQQSSHSLITSSNQQQQQSPPNIRMFPLTLISGSQLSALAHDTPMLSYGKPIGKIISLGGAPERREAWVVPFLRAGHGGAGGVGWPLPARKVVQRKDGKGGGSDGGGWVVEKFLS
jgi:ATP-dependent RNA helicase DHX37/DHR1